MSGNFSVNNNFGSLTTGGANSPVKAVYDKCNDMYKTLSEQKAPM